MICCFGNNTKQPHLEKHVLKLFAIMKIVYEPYAWTTTFGLMRRRGAQAVSNGGREEVRLCPAILDDLGPPLRHSETGGVLEERGGLGWELNQRRRSCTLASINAARGSSWGDTACSNAVAAVSSSNSSNNSSSTGIPRLIHGTSLMLVREGRGRPSAAVSGERGASRW